VGNKVTDYYLVYLTMLSQLHTFIAPNGSMIVKDEMGRM